jgi:hypothetical protein
MADEREYGWNDEIENDSNFVLLPPGDYPIKVLSFERSRFAGSAKLPPCPMAILSVVIMGDGLGETEVKHRLYLHSVTEGLLCQFFTSIGHREHGEKLKMDWGRVPHSLGMAKVGVRRYKTDSGEDREINEILRFLEPGAATSSPADAAPAAAPRQAAARPAATPTARPAATTRPQTLPVVEDDEPGW